MTYRELIKKLSKLSDDQLDSDVTIHTDNDEYFQAKLNISDETCDVLDEGHPYLAIKE